MPKITLDLMDYMESMIERIPEAGCWIWMGQTTYGYGRLPDSMGNRMAHRVMFERVKGPIPEGLEIDHLCRVKPCVNPAHLEAVTHRVNVLRGVSMIARNAIKTHCKRGHPLSGENLRIDRSGPGRTGRICRTCVAMGMARFKAIPGNREKLLAYWREYSKRKYAKASR